MCPEEAEEVKKTTPAEKPGLPGKGQSLCLFGVSSDPQLCMSILSS